MEESIESTTAPNRTVIILLAVIVVLLLAIVAFFVFGGGARNNATTDAGAAADVAANPMTTAPATAFDPATATTVPAGETPEQYTVAYFDAVVSGDYQTAYDRLPADKKAAQDAESFASQLAGYGFTGYTIDEVIEEDEEARVTATASTSGGQFAYLWTFVKNGDGWLVKSRTLPGMGQ